MAKMNPDVRAELENRIRFETLISDISARFVRLPSSEVDAEIERALRQILDFSDVDRCGVMGVREDRRFVWATHICCAEGIEPVSEDVNLAVIFPWCYEKLITKGEHVVVSRMTELPPEAEQDRLSWAAMGAKSNLTISLFSTQGVRYLLAIQSIHQERDWPQEFVPRLKLLGEIFVNAMERRNADQALYESEDRLSMALDAANAGAWSMDVQSNQVWVSATERELFGFQADEHVTFDSFLHVIHPDDRESVRTAVEKAIRTKTPLFVEYRITQPDGSVRWIAARGHIHCNAKGEPDRLVGISVNITEHKRVERQLEERLRFETLLANLSADFVNSSADQVDRMIEDAQRQVCQCLGLDISALWQVSVGNPGLLTLTHVYRPLAGPPLPEPMDAQEYFPWCQEQLMAGKLIAVSSVEEAPAEAARDRETWRHYGIKTTLTIPLAAGGGPTFGAVSFNDMKKERQWTEPLIKQLELVAQIFANALARKRSEQALRDSEQRLNLATDSAGVGLWIVDVHARQVWVTPKLRELLNIASDEKLDCDSFLKVIHLDDHEAVRRTEEQTLQRKEEYHVEYRVVLPDSGIRWIGIRGHLYFRSSGELDKLMGVALDITERKRTERELRDSRATLRTFASRLLTIRDEESRRLARELHDDFTQRLAVLAMEVSKLEVSPESAKAGSRPTLKHVREEIVRLSSDIHDVARQLHPSIIDDLGLGRAIQSECSSFMRRTGIVVNYGSVNIPSTLSRDTSVGLFRIVQEALRNIQKHAHVKEADVLLAGSDESITLTIHDTGTGFDPAGTAGQHGLGLFSMKERAQLIRGTFSVDSATGHGTQIQVVVPLERIEHG